MRFWLFWQKFIIYIICYNIFNYVFNASQPLAAEVSLFEIRPWSVGQYALYQIISMEGEDVDNRYRISLIGEEEVSGKKFFWLALDIYESVTYYGYNKITKELKRNVSFKALVPPKDTASFTADPAAFISGGIFLKDAVRFAVMVENDAQWHWINPNTFFDHSDVIENTPYSLSPHARGRINFNKLKINSTASPLRVPAGRFSCFHFSVTTDVDDEYWDEGFDLWHSSDIPILGLVKMEFSKTRYWDKWQYRKKIEARGGLSGFLSSFYKRRVPGRWRPDTCTILLLDYGPRQNKQQK